MSRWQAARKRDFVQRHPLFGQPLLCAHLRALLPEVEAAWSVPEVVPSIAYLLMGEADATELEAAMWSVRADVYTLTYRMPRPDALFCPDLAKSASPDQSYFSRGRNALLVAAQLEELRRGAAYTYYIFADSDLEAVGGWRSRLPGFEAFLLEEWQPAVGVPTFINEASDLPYTHLFQLEQASSDPNRPRTTYHFDYMFVAVHREAARLLLPLDSSLDVRNAIVSQWNMTIWAGLLFRGHVLVYRGMEIRNPEHGRAPDSKDLQAELEAVSAGLRRRLPSRVRHCVLDPWNAFAGTFSEYAFSARHLMGKVRSDFRLASSFETKPTENGVFFMHSYFPWGNPARKRWDYGEASLWHAPSCDDAGEPVAFWWGRPCLGQRGRGIWAWMVCGRSNIGLLTPEHNGGPPDPRAPE